MSHINFSAKMIQDVEPRPYNYTSGILFQTNFQEGKNCVIINADENTKVPL